MPLDTTNIRTFADLDRARAVCAEQRAVELVELCYAALAGAPHWRRDMGAVLGEISRLEYREPPARNW
jgi:hypothetical protein